MIGTRIGQYLIEAHLGAGAMGVVYRAFDTRLERRVALKVLPKLTETPTARQRLLHEARSASALNHPHICTMYEVGESGETMYLVMEYIEGRTLGALIPSAGFPAETVALYGSQIAGALAHAHAGGVVHRDLKSANVIVTPNGHAKVLDFGLAQRQVEKGGTDPDTHLQDSFLSPGRVVGTLTYMSPETLRGEVVDGRADIWALGVMLHEMASASLPFAGDTTFQMSGHILYEPPAALPDRVPATLRGIVAKCLAKEPGRRYQDASEVRAALETLQSGTHAVAVSTAVARDTAADKPALLVLPFANLAADPESDYFADGLTEEIIADLSSLRQLRVISSTSSMQFKGTTLTVHELGQRLRVGHVLEGSVRRIGPALRITAKLIDTASDSPVWGQKYSGTLEDVFAFQETLSRSIVGALRVTLTAEEDRQLKDHPIADVRAYDWYLRAKQEMLRFTKEGVDRAVEYLEKSEAIAGENVLLLAAKGEAYWQYINSGLSADPSHLDKAEACARRALEIDPQSPQGHRVAGLVRLHRGDVQGALRQLKRALDLAPNDPDCLLWGCLAAAMSGKMTFANAWAARLVEVDPVTPFHQLMPGTMAWMQGDYARAWELWSERHAAILENPLMRLVYGHVAVITGRVEEGDRILGELARSSPDSPFGQLASVYRHAFDGDREQFAVALTPALVATLEGDLQYCWFLGQCHALVGDVDGGIRWIEAAAARGFINHDLLARLDPFLAHLRTDPRFETLMQKVASLSDALDFH
jgi:eukaryotic-like serine/threonine-protein kinase